MHGSKALCDASAFHSRIAAISWVVVMWHLIGPQNPGFERVVLIGPVDEARLRQRLSEKFGGILEVIETLNQPKVEFKNQLADFFKIIESKDRRLLLMLDDFEQNI